MKQNKKEKQKISKQQQWSQQLSSGNLEQVKQTIKEIREQADFEMLDVLLKKLVEEKNDAVKNELIKLLSDVKDKRAAEVFFSYVANKDYEHARKDLLSVMWQSRLDFSPYLEQLVDFFIDSDLDVAFEAFTVIEYIESPVDDDVAQQSVKKLKERLEQFDQQKKFLVVDLVNMLKNKKKIKK